MRNRERGRQQGRSAALATILWALFAALVVLGCSGDDRLSPTEPKIGCGDDETACGAACVDLATDHDNCGACGIACAPEEACGAGACALACPPTQAACFGVCLSLDSDHDNCGDCGQACPPGLVCSHGACAVACQSDLTPCGGSCADTSIDPAHCGGCDVACGPTEVCSGGVCLETTPVTIQILDVSDWHAQLDPLSVGGEDVGGAAVLSAYFQAARAENPNTLTVTAGDSVGASPPLSSYFGDEPAILAMNLMGFDATTFGNHEFDAGLDHLQSLIDLADFTYVSANLSDLSLNLRGVAAPFKMFEVGGVRVALIGLTNPDAQDLTVPGNFGTMNVNDPVASAMLARDAAKSAGAQVFVAIAHMGATLYDAASGTWSGPLIDLASGLSGFNVVLGDHTDLQVSTVINGALVVENQSKGRTFARVSLEVVPWTAVVVQSDVEFVTPLAAGVTPDPAVEALLDPYRADLSAQLDGVIGVATDVFPRGNNIERLGEVAIGDLIADAIRLEYGSELGLVNGGGIRAPLPSTYLPADTQLRRDAPGYAPGPPFDLVTGDSYAVLPFGNVVVTRTVTGGQLWAALENGISAMPAPAGRFPQISGFGFTYSVGAPVGSRVTEVHLADGTPIPSDATTYTLSTVDFVNSGGDGYSVLNDGMGTTRELMAEVLVHHIQALGTITPALDGRITQVP